MISSNFFEEVANRNCCLASGSHNDVEHSDSSESNGDAIDSAASNSIDHTNLSVYDVMEGEQQIVKNGKPDSFASGETSTQLTHAQTASTSSALQSAGDDSYVSLKVPKIDSSLIQELCESSSVLSSEELKSSKQNESEVFEETAESDDTTHLDESNNCFGDVLVVEDAMNGQKLPNENPKMVHDLHSETQRNVNLTSRLHGSTDQTSPGENRETQISIGICPRLDGTQNQGSPSNSSPETEDAPNSASDNENSDRSAVTQTIGNGDAPETSAGSRVCSDSWHTPMCRAPSPKYYQGTDVDDLVSETEDTLGGAVFSERVPDLIHDDLDSEDFAMYSDHEQSSSVSSASSHSSATTNASVPNRTSNVSDDTGEYNITDGDASRPINDGESLFM